jgi:monovalent cation/proton antiporter MnhG/PhaG subunit
VTVRSWIEDVLLGLGVGCELLCVLGVLLMRSALARLHYSMAATTVGLVLIVAAVVVHESFNQAGINAIAIGAFLFVLNPVLANATARAIRRREFGEIVIRPEEEPRQ